MPVDDRQDEGRQFRKSPTGPWVAAPRALASQPKMAERVGVGRRRRPIWSAVLFILLMAGFGIRAYSDLSRPEAWAYWKESYLSPSMTSSLRILASDSTISTAGPAGKP